MRPVTATSSFVFALAAVVAASSVPAHGQPGVCEVELLYSVDDTENLRELDPYTGTTINVLPMEDDLGLGIFASHALTMDPISEQLYGIINIFMVGPSLCTVDPWSGLVTFIGNVFVGGTGVIVESLDFDADGNLYGVTAATGSFPRELIAIDKTNGFATSVCTFENGDGNDRIAFDPEQGVFYHAAGQDDVVFEELLGFQDDPCGVSDIPVAGTPLADEEVLSITHVYDFDTDRLLWVAGGPQATLYGVSAGGMVDPLGVLDHHPRAIAGVIVPTACPPLFFVRGDANLDGAVNFPDAIFLLSALFVIGSPQVLCDDAADFNDDGVLSIIDPIFALNFFFIPGSPPPPWPYPECDWDGTPDDGLNCDLPPDNCF